MFVTRLDIDGLRHAERRTVEGAERIVSVGSGADGGAIFDALDLFAAALAPVDLAGNARRLGWDTPETETDGNPAEPELTGLAGPLVAATLADDVRSVTLEAEIRLDPPLYGRLRDHAVRDPRMVTALGQRPAVSIKVGWLFNRDRSGAQPRLLAFRIGEVPFDTSGKERPAWLPDLCTEIGARFARTNPEDTAAAVAERLLAASVSPDAQVRAGAARLVDAVGLPPFGYPPPGVVRHEAKVALVFGSDLTPARQLGRPALDAVRWCEALYVRRPDVLAIDEPIDAGITEWLGTVVEGTKAPIEQVWVR